MLSIILPVLNEEAIDKKIDFLVSYLKDYKYEILIVDDSTDEVFQSLKKELGPRQGVHLIRGDRKGKGAAVKKAALQSAGDIVFFIDADFRIPLENIQVFTDLISRQGYDLVIAQRPFNKTPRSPLRLFVSLSVSGLVRLFVFNSMFFYDTQCGFKAFKGNILKQFAQKQIIDRGMFDVEYLYMARFNKMKIGKVDVAPLPEMRASRFIIARVMGGYLSDLLRIKVRGVLKFYKIGIALS